MIEPKHSWKPRTWDLMLKTINCALTTIPDVWPPRCHLQVRAVAVCSPHGKAKVLFANVWWPLQHLRVASKSITVNVPLNANWVFGSKITWFIPRSRSGVISVFNHRCKMNISDSLFIAHFWPFKVPVPEPLPFSAPWMLNEFQLKVLSSTSRLLKKKKKKNGRKETWKVCLPNYQD